MVRALAWLPLLVQFRAWRSTLEAWLKGCTDGSQYTMLYYTIHNTQYTALYYTLLLLYSTLALWRAWCSPPRRSDYRCLWQKHSFCASLGLAILQQKLLSSPWLGAPKAYLRRCLLLRRSVSCTDTGIDMNSHGVQGLCFRVFVCLSASVKIHQRGVQWKQGVVVYIIL